MSSTKTMMTYANERIAVLQNDLDGAKSASKRLGGMHRLLEKKDTLWMNFQSQSTKFVGVEAKLSGIKVDLKEARMNSFLSIN